MPKPVIFSWEQWMTLWDLYSKGDTNTHIYDADMHRLLRYIFQGQLDNPPKRVVKHSIFGRRKP